MQGLEIIWFEIHASNKNCLIGTLYRPPSSTANYWDLFSLNLNKVLDNNLPIFLLSDFNTNILSNQSTRFKQILQRLNLHNLINTPTNFTNPEGTCIDLLITSDPALVRNTSVSPLFCSTHSVIGLDLQFCSHKQNAYRREIVDYNNADLNKLNRELANINWDVEVFNSCAIDGIYSKFTNVLNSTVDKYVPKKVVTIRPRDKVLMNSTIRILMRKRNRIHRKAVKTQNPLHWEKYRYLRNKIIDEIRISRHNYNKKNYSTN